MMKKYSSFFKRLYSTLLIFFLTESFFFAAESSSWVLATEKFSYVNKTADSVYDGIASLLPSRILGSMGNSLFRNVQFDETYERNLNSLRTERASLFLQLSSEIKKRDAIVLSVYDNRQLKASLKTEDDKIKEIKKKLEENLANQKEKEQLLKNYTQHIIDPKNDTAQSELDKYAAFFKNFIYENEQETVNERISFYKGDVSALYAPGAAAKSEGYAGAAFEKEILAAKINGLLSGEITAYQEYIYVAVSLYVYPGAKYVTTVSEVGTIDELNFIAESLAQQLLPALTNSMPISLFIKMNPPEASKAAQMYIDGNLIQNFDNEINLDSGVHFIQFSAENYKSVETSYFFTGNHKYMIEVNLKEVIKGEMFATNQNPKAENAFLSKISRFFTPEVDISNGLFYVNGIQTEKSDDKARISINGDLILGQFVSENGESSFFYISPENAVANQLVYIKTEAINRNDYIEKHRRRMYNAYSGLVVSLIPFFVSKGQYQNYLAAKDADKANIWNIANKVSKGISFGCGAWFVYEMVRYFISADSVIPKRTEIIGDYVPVFENITESAVSDVEGADGENSASGEDGTLGESAVSDETVIFEENN